MSKPSVWEGMIAKSGDDWYDCENNADLPRGFFEHFQEMLDSWGSVAVPGEFMGILQKYGNVVVGWLSDGNYRIVVDHYENRLLEPSEVPLYGG